MALTPSNPEKAPSLNQQPSESGKLIVSQPLKIQKLMEDLNTIQTFEGRVREQTGEDRSGDWSGSGQGGQQDDGQLSPREQAIQNMPEPAVLRVRLEQHIKDEVKTLEKLAKRARSTARPGGAYVLNEIYAKIRRLNTLLAELVEASVDMLKKLFIRVFIDQQSIL